MLCRKLKHSLLYSVRIKHLLKICVPIPTFPKKKPKQPIQVKFRTFYWTYLPFDCHKNDPLVLLKLVRTTEIKCIHFCYKPFVFIVTK